MVVLSNNHNLMSHLFYKVDLIKYLLQYQVRQLGIVLKINHLHEFMPLIFSHPTQMLDTAQG